MNMQLKYVLLLCSFFVGPSTTLWAPPQPETSATLGAASGVSGGTNRTRHVTPPSEFPLRTSALVASSTAKASHPAPVGQKQQTDLSNHVVAAMTYQIKPKGPDPANTFANGRRSLRSGNTSALRTRASQSTASPSQPPPPPPLTPQSSASSVVSLDSATSEDEPLATQQKTKQPGFLSRLFSSKATKRAAAPAAKPPAQKSWWQRWFSSKNAPDAAATTAGNDAAIAERFAQKLQSRASSNATATDAQEEANMPRRSPVGQNGMIARTTTSNSYSATYSNRRFNAHGATQVRVGRDTKGNVVRRTQ